jgi:integrase
MGVSYALRISHGGRRHFLHLGTSDKGMTRAQAVDELEKVRARMRLGEWEPPTKDRVRSGEVPMFRDFAKAWLDRRIAHRLAPKTLVHDQWSLNHLGPYFNRYRMDEIDVQAVDGYLTAKARERIAIEERRAAAKAKGERFTDRPLSNSSINSTARTLAALCEDAVDYGWIAANPATGRKRRLKAETPARPWVEPEQLPSLLDASSGTGRLLLVLLAGCGLRIGEALALKWSSVDLGTGSLHVLDAKTEKGVREVHLSAAVRDELAVAKADGHPTPGAYVIATSTGRKHNPSNLRRDVVEKTVGKANGKLEEVGIAPIGHLTFHGLRRTYASLRCACGDDVRYTADQLGHEDPRFTLRVYAKATRRRERMVPVHREQYDRAIVWASIKALDPLTVPASFDTEATKSPV